MAQTPQEELDRLLAECGRARAPLYQWLGGPVRTKVRILTPMRAGTPEELRALWAQGARAFAVPVEAGGPVRRFVSDTVRRLEALRAAGGESADFVLSCRAQLTPQQASRLARALEGFHLLWMDEPCPVHSTEGVRKLAEETVVPLGFGASLEEPAAFLQLLSEGLAAVLRPSLPRFGVQMTRKIAALAESYYVAVAPLAGDAPAWRSAALHVAGSTANFFIQELDEVALEDGYAALEALP
jgi:galactonate dehydratase